MAFDQPLEADRIDDLGLFSTFIRAPIVGTLMWVLGGSKAMEEEEREKEQKMMIHEDDCASMFRSNPRHALNMEEVNGKLKKTAPRLIGSDISEFGECAAEAEALSIQTSSTLKSSSQSLRKSRKMSWSDESGQNLCEYIEESTPSYEPKKFSTSASSANAKPIKSAMRRTSSVSEVASDLSHASISEKQRYLPRGLGGEHSGLNIPTRPGDMAAGGHAHVSHGTHGYHSPEWGWYINTTPPTPEMYHSQYSATRGKLPSSRDGFPSQNCLPASGPPGFVTAAKTGGMGWPSVPL